MGIHQPGFQLLSLSGEAGTHAYQPCSVPDQLRLCSWVYAPLLFATIVLVAVRAATPAMPSRHERRDSHELPAYRAPASRHSPSLPASGGTCGGYWKIYGPLDGHLSLSTRSSLHSVSVALTAVFTLPFPSILGTIAIRHYAHYFSTQQRPGYHMYKHWLIECRRYIHIMVYHSNQCDLPSHIARAKNARRGMHSACNSGRK
ncbi:hypothetical protein EI94DRAFT_692288 [Lactarius quietus]|nr:hypothetical protein EI94DRAFT_692288 [Lactarius quietus]